jgi:ribosomal protein S18 acetylase RimI-like enzyme
MEPPPSTVRVRPAKPGDVPILFRMKQDLAKAEGNEGVLRASENDWLRDGFGRDARFRCFLAEQDSAIIGMVTYSEVYMTALGGATLSIQDLYIEPAFRRHGAGAVLVAQVAAAAVEQGFPLIQLNVLPDNPARKFYHRLGFRHLRECLTYAIGGQPMMELALPAAPALALALPR